VSTNRAQSKAGRKRRLINRQRRIQWRLRGRHWTDQPRPMFSAGNIHYELADRTRGLGPGGIGAMHLLARRTGLVEAIDRRLHLLKVHLPYHESDHVLNIAYNLLAGGTCLEDLERWRNDEVYLDALGAQRIPDPTTAGDFCRRFKETDVEILMNTINDARVKVWQQQPASFFEEAVIEGDGTMAETTSECKQGMDINYKGQWGYQPLLISLANTAEPLYLVNRRGWIMRNGEGGMVKEEELRRFSSSFTIPHSALNILGRRPALTRPSLYASGRGSSGFSCAEIRTLRKPSIWMVGTVRGCGSSSASMRCRT